MNIVEFDKQLQEIFKNFRQNRLWGQIQVDFQRGTPVVIRVSETKKLEENNHYGKNY